MIRAFLPLPLLLLAAAGEAPFQPAGARFPDAAACKAHLAALADAARGGTWEAVKGPYDLAADDVRIHMVRPEGSGHRIAEHRCLGAALDARSWHHSMEAEEEAFTIESVLRTAEWLKKGRTEQ